MPSLPDANAWEAFAGVVGVFMFLSAAVFVMRRVAGLFRPATAAAPPSPAPPGDDLRDLKETVARQGRELADMRLSLAEHYLRRDDWVPTMSRVLGMLEQHSVALARLEERSLQRRPRAE